MNNISDLGSPLPRWRRILDALASFSIVVTCGVVCWSILLRNADPPVRPSASVAQSAPELRRPQQAQLPQQFPLPVKPLSLVGAATRGSAQSRVVIVEYSDFQCPYCSKFANETLPRIDAEYVQKGRVLLAFRHLPIEAIHPLALKAAEASECAGRQGKFWEMHNRLLADPKTVTLASLQEFASSIGLNSSTFDKCLAGEQTAKVRADLETAKSLGLAGTPSFFLGIRRDDGQVTVKAVLFGAQPFQRFKDEIDKLALP